MAATHLEARAARVHVRVKVFEELLAAFCQQCRCALRHLFRPTFPPPVSFTLAYFFRGGAFSEARTPRRARGTRVDDRAARAELHL